MKIFYLSIVLILITTFISISFSTKQHLFKAQPDILLKQQEYHEDGEFKLATHQDEDKSINEIINKGYKKLIDGLKAKNQFHNDEAKFFKLAAEKQTTNPTGYKCQHDAILEKQKHKIEKTIEKQRILKNNKLNIINLDNGDNGLKSNILNGEQAVNPSIPIRFKFDTGFITGTRDPYACYTVGSKISLGVAANISELPVCKTDGTDIGPCAYTCTANDIQSTDLQNFYKNNLLDTIAEIFQSKLKVRNPQSLLKFNSDVNEGICDYGVPVIDSLFTNGVQNTDIYVYVTSRPTTSSGTIAYALPCNFDLFGKQSDLIYGRPSGASINFNPRYFRPIIGSENSITYNEYIRVGLHEMTHALGFSSFFYQSYVVPNTATRIRNNQGADGTLQMSGTTPSGANWSYSKKGIFSDNVVAFSKDHYACDSITYAELEDYGGQGTSGSHWEMRTAGEEYMLGYVSPIMPITGLTFSILQDSGWYEVDLSKSEPLVWGKGLGCNFVQKTCSAENWDHQGYFCSQSGTAGCTGTRMGKGVCTILRSSTDLDPRYQHFSDPKLIGVAQYVADGCPFYRVEQSATYCFDQSKQSSAKSDIFESFTENSRCFEYQDSGKISQACWEQRCSNNTLQIKINNNWIECPDSTVTSNGVTVVCPKNYNICSISNIIVDSSSSSDINSAPIILPSSSLLLLFAFIILNF